MTNNHAWRATLCGALTAATIPGLSCAEESAWTREVVYTVDVAGVVDGAPKRAGRALDNLDIIFDGDLEKAVGWRGGHIHVYLLNNSGGQPNALAGTLQGIDNIEVARPRARLYELWIEQDFGERRGSILAGLYDLNSEFYATEASDLLIAPPFGIGSELSSTGPNGPSIFPSTALAARLRLGDPDTSYVQAAVMNAHASTLGDPGGVNTSLNHGLLLIAEAGWQGPLRLAAGAWRYNHRQDDIRDLAAPGEPVRRVAQGAYVLAEGLLHEDAAGRAARAFLRAGVSDGDTTDFMGGWQAGVRIDKVLISRPDSAFSLGVHQGLLSSKARDNRRDAGLDPASGESGLEIIYSDRIGRLTVQPDLQVVWRRGGDDAADAVVIAAVRFMIDLNE